MVRLADRALDEVRRRVQNGIPGHRGHEHDPLCKARKLLVSASRPERCEYRTVIGLCKARKLLVSASERITDGGRTRLRGLLDAGDPHGEVREAWHAEETIRGIHGIPDHNTGAATVERLALDSQDPGFPVNSIVWVALLNSGRPRPDRHAARVTNAATEAANNLMKRVKQAAFGFQDFTNHRIRALLYAGKPDRALLDSLTSA